MQIDENLLRWLEAGDVSIRYQLHRDLFDDDRLDLQQRIAIEGWGARFLAAQRPNGHWGKAFYSPKWISTHYTLLDLRLLCLSPDHPAPAMAIRQILAHSLGEDGGVNPSTTNRPSDVCVNGMFLNYAAYFGMEEGDLNSVVDFLLAEHMGDGGFNCNSNGIGAVHSSMHTTISVLEGILEYARNGYSYRLRELQAAAEQSREFLLQHRLYQSDRTGEVIDKKWLMLSFPSRWKYDILRALDYFQAAGIEYDPRMQDALDVLVEKRRKDHTWPVQAKHPGQTHFEMEVTGGPSRWNTLRALRTIRHMGQA